MRKERKIQYITKSHYQTRKLGKIFAQEILKKKQKKGAFVLALIGDLGGGKTTFLQGFAKGLGIKEKILSPTFVILKKFKITKTKNLKLPRGLSPRAISKAKNLTLPNFFQKFGRASNQKLKTLEFKNFFHLDCYRIKKPKEVLDLGFKEIISESQNIVAIEWADRVREILPEDIITLSFEFVDKKTRKVTLLYL